ncbi:MAG: hypothetical protein WCX46_01025 [Candidatus Paceibacterota bacterium]
MEKIKHFIESEKGKDILVVFIIILVGIASFELGRLSKENDSSGVKIEYIGQEANTIEGYNNLKGAVFQDQEEMYKNKINSNSKNFFASSRGKKYYPVDCSAGKTIKDSNKVYFSTREEAEKAGFELSSSCQ